MFADSKAALIHELTDIPRTKTLVATIDNIKRTCLEAANSPDCPVTIDEEQLISFIHKVDIKKLKRSSHLMNNPIDFKDEFSEINFHINLHLFNFGHGFRHPLHRNCGRGAWQTMKEAFLRYTKMLKKGLLMQNPC